MLVIALLVAEGVAELVAVSDALLVAVEVADVVEVSDAVVVGDAVTVTLKVDSRVLVTVVDVSVVVCVSVWVLSPRPYECMLQHIFCLQLVQR